MSALIYESVNRRLYVSEPCTSSRTAVYNEIREQNDCLSKRDV